MDQDVTDWWPRSQGFAPLPQPRTRDGRTRRVGVEVEFGGISTAVVARIARETLGGAIEKSEAGVLLEDTRLGRIEVYLDTRFRGALARHGPPSLIKAVRTVVPVEIVTEPLLPDDLPRLEDMLAALREAGAEGSRASLLQAFGVHFNPEARSLALDDILPVLRAYAMAEGGLRHLARPDVSRRFTGFVDPYPDELVDALADDPPRSLDALIGLYLDRAPSRNHGLDMLCLFAEIDADRVAAALDDHAVNARPCFHFRLPECRIDDPGWTLAGEWNKWVTIERLAADAEALEALVALRRRYPAGRERDRAAARILMRAAPAQDRWTARRS